MPPYPWLIHDKIDVVDIAKSVRALERLGTPYVGTDNATIAGSLQSQGGGIVAGLSSAGITAEWDDEIIALTAYLQRLGRDGRAYLEQLEQQGGNQ
jgi:cytochrome c oxidase cbb3-type subunit I/II